MEEFKTTYFTIDTEGRKEFVTATLQDPDSFDVKAELTDKTLYDVCEHVLPDEDISKLIEDMKAVMYEGKGCGLAANQIGSNKRVIVTNAGGYRKTIINPIITGHSVETVESREGCLSFPGASNLITRHKRVVVEGFTPEWRPI